MGLLGLIVQVAFFVLSIAQLSAVADLLHLWLGWYVTVCWLLGIGVVCFLPVPFLTTPLAVLGAHYVWDWDWTQSVLVFVGPFMVLLGLSLVAGVTPAVFSRFQVFKVKNHQQERRSFVERRDARDGRSMAGQEIRQQLTNQPKTSEIPILYFKNSTAAFEYACIFCDTAIRKGAHLPSLVQSIGKDGRGVTLYQVKVASSDGGFDLAITAMQPLGRGIKAGDLVSTWISNYDPSKGASKHAVVGLLTAKLQPAFDPDRGWLVERN